MGPGPGPCASNPVVKCADSDLCWTCSGNSNGFASPNVVATFVGHVAETQRVLQKKHVLYWSKGEKEREEEKLQRKTNSKSIHLKTSRIQIHENR